MFCSDLSFRGLHASSTARLPFRHPTFVATKTHIFQSSAFVVCACVPSIAHTRHARPDMQFEATEDTANGNLMPQFCARNRLVLLSTFDFCRTSTIRIKRAHSHTCRHTENTFQSISSFQSVCGGCRECHCILYCMCAMCDLIGG